MAGSTDDLAFTLAQRLRRVRRPRRRAAATAVAGMTPQPAAASPSQRKGSQCEEAALRHLTAAGLHLLARNLRCKAGEIDLIMRDGELLVFVEVRARGSAQYGGALASVGRRKQARLLRAAHYFLLTVWRGPAPRCRFDVVAFEGSRCEWVRDAFGENR